MASNNQHASSLNYSQYLGLDNLLSSQNCLSQAHDENLFIIIHQTYELWFKQILIETDRIQNHFSDDHLSSMAMGEVNNSLSRIADILNILLQQLGILEKMTPLDFLDFRHVFWNASGFQSAQFRKFEVALGLEEKQRITYGQCPFHAHLDKKDQKDVIAQSQNNSLFDLLDQWLSRTPFIEHQTFDFWQAYQTAVDKMLEEDVAQIKSDTGLQDDIRHEMLKRQDQIRDSFQFLFNADEDDETYPWRLSKKSVRAALFINLYRDQPALQAPYQIMNHLMDIDELLTLWRFRHALMVQRMLGIKTGSGGSSGFDYLQETARKHRIYQDLCRLSTYLIPRSKLPELPDALSQELHFHYRAKEAGA